MRTGLQAPRGGVLDELASTYARARVFLGLGLIVVTVAEVTLAAGSARMWVLAGAGVVILAHSFAMRFWDMNDTITAILVDLASVLIATLLLTDGDDHVTAILTLVGASVIITLFTIGWIRYALVVFTGSFILVTLLAAEGWVVEAVIGDFLGAALVVVLVMSVISGIRRRLIEQEAARAQTVGVVSHELRNHLTGVIGAIELVTDPRTGLGAAEADELLQMANDQAVEAGDVIDDLLVASRTERGVLDSLPELIDLAKLTDTVIRRTRVEGREMILDDSGGPVWAIADPVRYKQVLRNLLTNAIRYGGPVTRVTLTPLGDTVSVVVADNGDGVDPSEESVIFDAYRVGSHRRQVSESAGLGLWIARNLARNMHGDLTYRRLSGQTIFELTLPAYDVEDDSLAYSDLVTDDARTET